MTKRKPTRLTMRKRHRSALHCCTRMLHGARRPNYLLQALTAFRRAIRSHRRLMKLAPSFFDAAVVNRLQKQREESLAYQRVWEPILNKVYGVTSATLTPDTRWDPVLPKSSRSQRAVECELIQCELWLKIGQHHLERFQQSRPHAFLDFSQIARLLEVSINLRCLACGISHNL